MTCSIPRFIRNSKHTWGEKRKYKKEDKTDDNCRAVTANTQKNRDQYINPKKVQGLKNKYTNKLQSVRLSLIDSLLSLSNHD